jgi:hypothetical protein
MTDHEWAEAFVSCKIAGTGYRFADTVEVLEKKLGDVRREAASGMLPSELERKNRLNLEAGKQQNA